MEFITRELYLDEMQVLKTLKNQTEERIGKKPIFSWFILSIFIGIIFFCFATFFIGRFGILSAIIGVILIVIAVVVTYNLYKTQKKDKEFLRRYNTLIEIRTVKTCRINATRIATTEEGEAGWCIVELSKNKVLYLFKFGDLFEFGDVKRGKFPCLQFEIYDKNFFELTGNQIYPFGEEIEPVMIDSKKTWRYMSENDTSDQFLEVPEFLDFDIENINFDEVIKKIETL